MLIEFTLEDVAERLIRLRKAGDSMADKLLEIPRFPETLAFISAMCHLPGGFDKFCEDFLAESGGWIATLPPQMVWDHNFRNPGIRELMESNPEALQYKFPNARWQKEPGQNTMDAARFKFLLEYWCTGNSAQCSRDPLFLEFHYRFPGFVEAMGKHMDRYANRILEKTANTRLRQRAHFELEFARSTCIPMTLIADTRRGKTTAVEAYCDAYPGRARLVTIPHSDSKVEFAKAHAEAFGIHIPKTPATARIESSVKRVLLASGIMPVYDEAHYLIPTRYNRLTPPERLNWVRANIIDKNVPCAFFATPQSYRDTLHRYAEVTHYNLEQWIGRMPKPVLLLETPNHDELMAVSLKLHPEFNKTLHEELCDATEESIDDSQSRENGESGYKIIKLAGARAKCMARQLGKTAVDISILREAIEWAGENALSFRTAADPAKPKSESPPGKRGQGSANAKDTHALLPA